MSEYMGDVCVITGKFTNADGQEKNRYLKLGAWFQGEHGVSVKLEALPMPNADGTCWLSLFEKKDSQQPQQQQPQQQQRQQQQPQQQQQQRPAQQQSRTRY